MTDTIRVTSKRLKAMTARFERVLGSEMAERDNRLQVADFGDGHETLFAWCERHRMYVEVNRARAEQGHQPVPLGAVQRVEQLACGHVDYFRKFTFYCAELAFGAEEPRP